MVDIFNSGQTGFRQNTYGNIQQIGTTPDGRTIYRVIDSQGEESGKLSVPNNQVDKFESAYKDVMESAPQIQKYVIENSSEKDIKRRRNLSRAIVATGGVIGAAIPIALTQNISRVKSILATVTGIIVGISAGFAASLAATTPPGTYKFAKATRTFSKLDIQPIPEEPRNTDN